MSRGRTIRQAVAMLLMLVAEVFDWLARKAW